MGSALVSVKKGNIFFHPSWRTWFLYKIKFVHQIIFTETSLQNTKFEETGHSEILFGSAFGFFHKDNSVKFSWRPEKDKIAIFASASSDGKKSSYRIANLNIDYVYKFTIRKFKKHYTFSIFDSENILVAYYKVHKKRTLFFGREFF